MIRKEKTPASAGVLLTQYGFTFLLHPVRVERLHPQGKKQKRMNASASPLSATY